MKKSGSNSAQPNEGIRDIYSGGGDSHNSSHQMQKLIINDCDIGVDANFALQGLLINAERKLTWQTRRNAEKFSQQIPTEENNASKSQHTDGLHVKMMFRERQHLLRLAVLRNPDKMFLDFIKPFRNDNKDFGIDFVQRHYSQINPETTAGLLELEKLFYFEQEEKLWRLQNEIGTIGRQLGAICPKYGFLEYSAMRARIIESGMRYIGRSMHLAARQAHHHQNMSVTWERCYSILDADAQGADASYNSDNDVTEMSAPIHEYRQKKSLNTKGKREKNFIAKRQFDELKAYFKPVAHILAAMDVIACRAWLPLAPPDETFWPTYRPEAGYDKGQETAGRTFMDDPRDDTMTRTVLAYALWFQNWGLKKSSAPGSRALLDQSNLQWLGSDLPLPEVLPEEQEGTLEDGTKGRFNPAIGNEYRLEPRHAAGTVGGFKGSYDLPSNWKFDDEIIPISENHKNEKNEKKNNNSANLRPRKAEAPLPITSPPIILPPLPPRILQSFKIYKAYNSR